MEELQTYQPLPEDCVFALDIGTRSVIGIVGRQNGQVFEVLATERLEHPQRAMVDGQIEDIRQVARIAGQVKDLLEKRLGFSLTRVNVAAAGRALKSDRAQFEMELSVEPVTPRQVHDLEMGAISLIRQKVSEEANENVSYYCVGHSVVRYFLDDYPFSTIVGHKGSIAKTDVIATFLPAAVVDSLCAAMAIIGCEIAHLTLEPIAAMNAVIPVELRLLNLALVDIGAGTSDIAISENGTVAAYTMATVAGDEITEELIRRYLVDFQTAERMKHEAADGKGQIAYQDILGFEYHVPLGEMIEALRPAVDSLGKVICDRIMEANGKSPAAVFLVGGGSLIPLLCDSVAQGLQLDRNKVAVGGNNFIRRVASGADKVSGPEYATPLGIALTAIIEGAQHGFYLFVNGKKTRLFRNDHVTVMDALLLCGYHYHQLMGHHGHSITYLLNGEKQILRGGHLTPAVIHVNGIETNLTASLNNEDHVDVISAQDGEDAYLDLTMLKIDPFEGWVHLNELPLRFGRDVTINGETAKPGQEINDRDVIVTNEVLTLGQLSAQLGVAGELLRLNSTICTMDTRLCEGDSLEAVTPIRRDIDSAVSQVAVIEEAPVVSEILITQESPAISKISVAQKAPAVPELSVAAETHVITDVIAHEVEKQSAWQEKLEQAWESPITEITPTPEAIQTPAQVWSERVLQAWNDPTAAAPQIPSAPDAPVAPPANPVAPSPVAPVVDTPVPVASATSVSAPLSPETPAVESAWNVRQGIKITLNGESVWLQPKAQGEYQFLDMLNLVDIDPTKPQGNIILHLNGRQASYLDDIRNGDTIEIRWESV